MSSFIDNLDAKGWEAFCEIMLRHHYTARHFWTVPDEDGGDCGIEFYTADGTIFQCYFPDSSVDMKTHKQRIQKKIRDDLKKLSEYEDKIAEMLGDIRIDQWVLLTPQYKSKDFLAYCNKKAKEVIGENLSFIDGAIFQVKIETADSYPEGKLYAQNVYSNLIDIPISEVTPVEKEAWKQGNSKFAQNIQRKSHVLMGDKSQQFQDRVVTKYLQIEKFLDRLREDHPDLYGKIEDSARARLDAMTDASVFEDSLGKKFVSDVVKDNQAAFLKHEKFFSDTNMQTFSFGYLSKWIAECYMDFVYDTE